MHGRLIIDCELSLFENLLFLDTALERTSERELVLFQTEFSDNLKQGDLYILGKKGQPKASVKIVRRVYNEEKDDWTLYCKTNARNMAVVRQLQSERKAFVDGLKEKVR